MTTLCCNLSLLLLLLILTTTSFFPCHSADRITHNQSLSGNQTIVSSGQNFVMGFFSPSLTSDKHYIGIWYYRVHQPQTIVWVANRDSPVSDPSASELRISGSNLVLFNESNSPIWSTNLTSSSSSFSSTAAIEVVLLDSGNLVLSPVGSSSSEPSWQSFDNPTDTWLPGGKIGVNKITGKSTVLTPWKSTTDPAPGPFVFEKDAGGSSQYFIFWKNISQRYWTSGTWNGQIFSLVPEMTSNYIYNFSYVDNQNESYFTYSVVASSSAISRFVLSTGGQIQQLSWLGEPTNQWNLFWNQPRVQCEVYAFCGSFGSCAQNSQPFCHCLPGFVPNFEDQFNSNVFHGGCRRRTGLVLCEKNNGSVEGDGFFPYYTKLPSNGVPVVAGPNGHSQDCEKFCLERCSCTAYFSDPRNNCTVWFDDLLNLQQDSTDGSTIYIRMAASELPRPGDNNRSNRNNNKTKKVIIIVTSILFTFLVVVIIMTVVRRKRRMMKPGKGVEGSLVAFSYRDLQNATRNFSEKLGGGGFGSVFKGVLPDSKTYIAVKKLESITQGEKQFRTEVSTIGTVQHVNLIRLRGFCSEGNDKKLIVYDYMPNGSLDYHIFQEGRTILDWKTRFEIVLGTARGLTYLHEKCRDQIIHCDIKPENILLDTAFTPKIADFGLAKLVGRDFSRVLTTMRGTRGYLAPEWISGVAITAKADVFSYGMMVFEILSGRRNTEQSGDGKVVNFFFPNWAVGVIAQGGDCFSLLDPKLEGNADGEELGRVCKAASWCIQDNEWQRPAMGQVVQILEEVLNVGLPPVPRQLQMLIENNQEEEINFFIRSASSSENQRSSQTQNVTVRQSSSASLSCSEA